MSVSARAQISSSRCQSRKARRDRYTADDYHKVSDEIKDDWELSGGIEDVELYLRIAWAISQARSYPEWKQGTEFKAIREASLGRGE
jgi:hypothetical protein